MLGYLTDPAGGKGSRTWDRIAVPQCECEPNREVASELAPVVACRELSRGQGVRVNARAGKGLHSQRIPSVRWRDYEIGYSLMPK